MSNEELCNKYNSGDRSALDELTQNNLGLIHLIARKYSANSKRYCYDDLFQEGWKGLFRAIETYRSDLPNSAKFSTWAVYWIRASINRFLENNNSDNEVSLNTPVGDGDDELINFTEDQDDTTYLEMWRRLENLEVRMVLDGLMNKYLSMQQREVIQLYYGWDGTKGMLFKDIGQIFEITEQGARNIHTKGISRLRKTGWAMKRFKEIFARKRIALMYKNPVLTIMYNDRGM